MAIPARVIKFPEPGQKSKLKKCTVCGRRKKPENLFSKTIMYRGYLGRRPKVLKTVTTKSAICKVCLIEDMEQEGIELGGE